MTGAGVAASRPFRHPARGGLRWVLLAAVLALAAPPGQAQPPASQPPVSQPSARLKPGDPLPAAELEAFVDGVARQAMADNHIAGAAVSVVQNGQPVLEKGYGFSRLAPGRPVDPGRTLFRIGSISKTFTWILVLREVEAGRMRLDAPINLYLPEALRIPDQGFDQPIRVRDLMNHTPGFEDLVFGQAIERDYARVRPLGVYLREERPRRVRPPERLVSYSNYGAGLAGAGVAEVTGKPFEALVESEITGPLGLGHTTFREPHPPRAGLPAPLAPVIAADMATGYRWADGGFQPRPFEYIEQLAPAGAASSTAADMSRYMSMMLAGGALGGVEIYGPATARAFSTPLPPSAPGVPAWRHGLAQIALPGGFLGVGHGGDTLSFHSNMVLVPQLNLGVFVTTNSDGGGSLAADLPRQIVERFYAPPSPPPATGSSALVADADAFDGVYLTDRRAYHGLEEMVDRLIGMARVKVTSDGHLALADGDRPQLFSPQGPPAAGHFESDRGDGPLVFQMKDGRAARFFTPDGTATFERAGIWRRTGTLVVMTLLTLLATVVALRDLLARARRDFRETSSQRRSGIILTTAAALWLLAIGLFGVWAAGTGDEAKVMYDWPGVTLVVASTCALAASLLSASTMLLLPLIWRGGRRVDSWTGGRKIRFTLMAATFTAYGLLLASWGALEPWSS
jgi:CubicO group peptidase (beta-lactamase class C family)